MKNSLLCIALSTLLASGLTIGNASAQKSHTVHRKTSQPAKRRVTGTPGQYPEASDRQLTDRDVEHLTPWGMKVMMNEIYARHGYAFRDASMKKHFRKEKWYAGKERNLKKLQLTATEQQNIAFIKQHQSTAKL